MTLATETEAVLTEVQVDRVDADGLAPVADDDPEYRAIRSSIRASGVRTPIVVVARSGGRFQLVEGRVRLCAARSLGLSVVPAVVAAAAAEAPTVAPAPAPEAAAPPAAPVAPAPPAPKPAAAAAQPAPAARADAPAAPAPAPLDDDDLPTTPSHGGYAAGARSRRWGASTTVRRTRYAPSASPLAASAETAPAPAPSPPAAPEPVAALVAAQPAAPPSAVAPEPVAPPPDEQLEPATDEPEVDDAAAAADGSSRGWQVRQRPTADAAAAAGRLARLAEAQTIAAATAAPKWVTRRPVEDDAPVEAHNGTAPLVDDEAEPPAPSVLAFTEVRYGSAVGDDDEPDHATHLAFTSPVDDEDEDEDEDQDEDQEDDEAQEDDDDVAGAESDDDFDPLPDEVGDTESESAEGESKLPSATPGVTRAAGMLSVGDAASQHAALRPLAQLRNIARHRVYGDAAVVSTARTVGMLVGLIGAAFIVITLVMQGDGASVSPLPVYGAIGGFLTALLGLAHERVKAARLGR